MNNSQVLLYFIPGGVDSQWGDSGITTVCWQRSSLQVGQCPRMEITAKGEYTPITTLCALLDQQVTYTRREKGKSVYLAAFIHSPFDWFISNVHNFKSKSNPSYVWEVSLILFLGGITFAHGVFFPLCANFTSVDMPGNCSFYDLNMQRVKQIPFREEVKYSLHASFG